MGGSVARGRAAAFLAACAALLTCWTARAEEPSAAWRSLDWREVSAGAEVAKGSWSAYTTMTVAPFGTLDEDGLRVRTSGGYGRYRYDGTRRIRGQDVATRFRGTSSFSDILLGIQARSGPATFKLFAGASGIAHAVTPLDAGNVVTGLDIAFKGALETWLEIGDPWWASLDISATGAHRTYGSRLRLGWRWQPELSIGAEAGLLGNASYDGGRTGLFVRWAPGWGEVSVSAGLTGTMKEADRDDGWSPYATVNLLLKY